MVIYLAGEVDEEARLDEMSPRQIVTELDKHVVGQRNAKRAVAIALRNRVRRQKLAPEMAVDVMPKNIIMGADIGTMPFKVIDQLFNHPLTDKGQAQFLADWAKSGRK